MAMRAQNGQGFDLPDLPLADRHLVSVMMELGPAIPNGMGISPRAPADWLAWSETGEIGPEDVRPLTLMAQDYTRWVQNTGLLSMAPVDLDSNGA